MTDTITILENRWRDATAKLPWGVQRAFHDALTLVEQGKLHMAYAADYDDGNPCLVNSTAHMLSATGGEGGYGKPGQHFGAVVGAFDSINRKFEELGFNSNKTVSADAAGFMLRHFGPIKSVEEATAAAKEIDQNVDKEGYIELAADADLLQDWLTNSTKLPDVVEGIQGTVTDRIPVKSNIEEL